MDAISSVVLHLVRFGIRLALRRSNTKWMSRGQVRACRIAVLGVVVVAATIWSACRGAPSKLPGAALGWAPLFFIERAGALLGAVGVIALVGWRALHGRFPIRFANIEYADEVKASATTVEAHEGLLKAAEAIDEAHEQRLKLIEAVLGLADPP